MAVSTAKRYADAGFTVVYQDIIIGPWLHEITIALADYRLAVVVLCPRADVIAGREAARAKTGYPDRESVETFDRYLWEETPRMGYWLDNSDLSVDETVDRLLKHLGEASI